MTSRRTTRVKVSTKNGRQILPRRASDLAEPGRLSQRASKRSNVSPADKQKHHDHNVHARSDKQNGAYHELGNCMCGVTGMTISNGTSMRGGKIVSP